MRYHHDHPADVDAILAALPAGPAPGAVVDGAADHDDRRATLSGKRTAGSLAAQPARQATER